VEIIQAIVWEIKKREIRKKILEYRCFSKKFFSEKNGQGNGEEKYDFDRLYNIFSNLISECQNYFCILDEMEKQKKNFVVPITREEKELAKRHETIFRKAQAQPTP